MKTRRSRQDRAAAAATPPVGSPLARERARRRRLEIELTRTIEREQARIGRDLHDGVCQLLTGLSIESERLSRRLARLGLAREQASAARIATLAASVTGEIHGIAHGLSPVSLDGDGLSLALADLAGATASLTGTRCRFHGGADGVALAGDVGTHLFRIAQEAVNNAVKHASARSIDITLERDAVALVLSVRDDGRRQRTTRAPSRGLGLGLMRQRAEAVGGTLEVTGVSPHGTAVTCRVPLPDAAGGAAG